MSKIIVVTLLVTNWLVIDVFAGGSMQLITKSFGGKKKDDPAQAYKKLFEESDHKKREKVVEKLRIIQGSQFAEMAKEKYRYNIDELIQFNDIDESKCKLNIMREFKARYKQANGGNKAIDKYVVETYEEQMKVCFQAAKEAVKNFIAAHKDVWEKYMVFFHELRRNTNVYSTKKSDWAGKQWEMKETMKNRLFEIVQMQRTEQLKPKVGSHVYDSLTGVKRNCQMYLADRLAELLQLQAELNSEAAHKDSELVAYLRYMSVCQVAVEIHDWGIGARNALVEETTPGFTASFDQIDAYLSDTPTAEYYGNPAPESFATPPEEYYGTPTAEYYGNPAPESFAMF